MTAPARSKEAKMHRNFFAFALILLGCGIGMLQAVRAQSDAVVSRYVVLVGYYQTEDAAQTALMNWRKDYSSAFVEAPQDDPHHRILIGPHLISDARAVSTEISLKRNDIDDVAVLAWRPPGERTQPVKNSDRLFIVSLPGVKAQLEAAVLEDRLRKAGYEDVWVEMHGRSYYVRVGPSSWSGAQSVVAKLPVEYRGAVVMVWINDLR